MNTIFLRGTLRNIQHSHFVKNTEYDRADLIVKNSNGKESVIELKFKKTANKFYKEGDTISLLGSVRSHSTVVDGKNKVKIYVLTYLDEVDEQFAEDLQDNYIEIDGRICKKEGIRVFKNGSKNSHFILANNIITENSKLNSYIPCVVWGNLSDVVDELEISDFVQIKGELRTREYVKKLPSGEEEIRMATELLVTYLESE